MSFLLCCLATYPNIFWLLKYFKKLFTVSLNDSKVCFLRSSFHWGYDTFRPPFNPAEFVKVCFPLRMSLEASGGWPRNFKLIFSLWTGFAFSSSAVRRWIDSAGNYRRYRMSCWWQRDASTTRCLRAFDSRSWWKGRQSFNLLRQWLQRDSICRPGWRTR